MLSFRAMTPNFSTLLCLIIDFTMSSFFFLSLIIDSFLSSIYSPFDGLSGSFTCTIES